MANAAAIGVHVCEGCGAVYDNIGAAIDCEDSHIHFCGALDTHMSHRWHQGPEFAYCLGSDRSLPRDPR